MEFLGLAISDLLKNTLSQLKDDFIQSETIS